MRKPAPTEKKVVAPTTSYPLWLPNDQVEVIQQAQVLSSKAWPDWISDAIDHFKKEPEDEIENLITTWVRDRKDKKKINVRITKECLAEIDLLCANNKDASKQACLQHACFIHALRTFQSKA
ncbi:hypothetical protein [Pseudomonas sp. EMN2]|uniref:hypothetical protein n=1 Tax=Pseudomonas sp. EMN2 TaxID=2615212 RepID=UPI00129BB7E4|nr:hypothetical protein [Pseudomonas sp. EMN2]